MCCDIESKANLNTEKKIVPSSPAERVDRRVQQIIADQKKAHQVDGNERWMEEKSIRIRN